jgi:hypothetical protein
VASFCGRSNECLGFIKAGKDFGYHIIKKSGKIPEFKLFFLGGCIILTYC